MREEIKDNIYVASDRFYDNYYDQCFISFPCVYPTVCVYLESTVGLDKLADGIRHKEGHTPLFDFDETGVEYDDSGWYEFSINLNGYNKHHVDCSIEVFVVAENCDDNEETYYIDLQEDEQEYIYQILDKELDCEERLRESADEYFYHEGKELTILERRP